MKSLIETSSEKYLRRMVRVLNAEVDGFYAPASGFKVKCNGARLKNSSIEVHGLQTEPAWFVPSRLHFEDGKGNEIVASRLA